MDFLSKNTEETKNVAINFVKILANIQNNHKATVLGLYGDLGGGKTTFMKYFAETLGIKDTIQSPTFVIMKFFNITEKIKNEKFSKLVHIDAYRIENESEMLNFGWEEIINNPKNLVCIEWPEKIKNIMPPHIKIYFEHGQNENERKIKIENYEKQ